MGVVAIKSPLFLHEHMIYYENKHLRDPLNNFSPAVLRLRLVNCTAFCLGIRLKELWLRNSLVRHDPLILNCYFDTCVRGERFEITGARSGCFSFLRISNHGPSHTRSQSHTRHRTQGEWNKSNTMTRRNFPNNKRTQTITSRLNFTTIEAFVTYFSHAGYGNLYSNKFIILFATIT